MSTVSRPTLQITGQDIQIAERDIQIVGRDIQIVGWETATQLFSISMALEILINATSNIYIVIKNRKLEQIKQGYDISKRKFQLSPNFDLEFLLRNLGYDVFGRYMYDM